MLDAGTTREGRLSQNAGPNSHRHSQLQDTVWNLALLLDCLSLNYRKFICVSFCFLDTGSVLVIFMST